MKHLCIFIYLFLSFLLPISLNAEQMVLSLEQAVAIALENNPDIRTKAIELESARRTDQNAWNNFLPSISANASVSNSHTLYDGTDNSKPKNSWSWSGSAGVSLSLNTSVPVKIKQASLNYAIAQTAFEKLKSEITLQVTNAFYALIAEKKDITIQKASQKLANQQLTQITTNYNYGIASELDVLKAKYAYQSMGPKITKATTTYNANKTAFLALIGLDLSTDFTVEGSTNIIHVVLPSASQLTAQFLENRFDVQQAHQNITKAELALDLQKKNTKAPSLNLSENLKTGNDISSNTNKNPQVSGSFSASVNIPITGWIPNSTENLNIKNSKDAVTTAQINLETVQKNAQQDISKKTEEVNRLYESLELNKLNSQIAERAYQLATDSYRNGLLSQTEYASQRQDMTTAQQTLMQAQIDYITSIYALASSLNISANELFSTYGVTTK